MVSIIVLVRNARQMAADCLGSLATATAALHLSPSDLEFILIDDCSDERSQIPQLLAEMRRATPAQVQIIRLREHSHYGYGVALGMSIARGENVLFFSHDMIVPPACLHALLESAALHPDATIIRPRSRHMDGASAQQLNPPLQPRNGADLNSFAGLVRMRFGAAIEPQRMFIGDAMLMKRSVIERIGVFDTRFFGFLADIDYGIRAQRAGFAVVTAMDAWLHHLGGGFTRDVELTGGDWKAVNAKNNADTNAAYKLFRAKWDPNLPDDYNSIPPGRLIELLSLPPGRYDDFVAKLTIDPRRCQMM